MQEVKEKVRCVGKVALQHPYSKLLIKANYWEAAGFALKLFVITATYSV